MGSACPGNGNANRLIAEYFRKKRIADDVFLAILFLL